MKRYISFFLILLAVLALLPTSAGATTATHTLTKVAQVPATCGYVIGSDGSAQQTDTIASDSAVSGEAALTVGDPNNQVPLPQKKCVDWAMAVMIGLVCFGASITATVIILKRKKK